MDRFYNLAILDIMGVHGFGLLKIANNQKILALMVTAYALFEEKKSVECGAELDNIYKGETNDYRDSQRNKATGKQSMYDTSRC